MKDDDKKLGLDFFSGGLLASLYSTITNSEIRGLFCAGRYLDALKYVLLFTVISYLLFAAGGAGFMQLAKSDAAQKFMKYRKIVFFVCAIVSYAVLMAISVYLFGQ